MYYRGQHKLHIIVFRHDCYLHASKFIQLLFLHYSRKVKLIKSVWMVQLTWEWKCRRWRQIRTLVPCLEPLAATPLLLLHRHSLPLDLRLMYLHVFYCQVPTKPPIQMKGFQQWVNDDIDDMPCVGIRHRSVKSECPFIHKFQHVISEQITQNLVVADPMLNPRIKDSC